MNPSTELPSDSTRRNRIFGGLVLIGLGLLALISPVISVPVMFAQWSFVALGLVFLAWGLTVSLVVAGFAYRFAAIRLPGWILSPRRWLALGSLPRGRPTRREMTA